jgi:hypothetical protein
MDVYPSEPEMRIRSELRKRTYHVDDSAEGIGFHHVFTLPQFKVPQVGWDYHFCPEGVSNLFGDICQLLYEAVKKHGNCCSDKLTVLFREYWIDHLGSYWQLPNFSRVDIYATKVKADKPARRSLVCERLLVDEFTLDSIFRIKETQLLVEAYFKLDFEWLPDMVRSHVLSTLLYSEFVPRLRPYYGFPLSLLVEPDELSDSDSE